MLQTHNNTKNAVAEMNESLQDVSSSINNIKNVNKEIKELITKSNEIWDKEYQKLAYYIEHDELEKVTEALIRAKSNINAEEYNTAIENIDGCIFLLQHIEEKDKFSLKKEKDYEKQIIDKKCNFKWNTKWIELVISTNYISICIKSFTS